MNAARLTTLAAFIRSQAELTDGHPHKPGPGSVKLNNEEALLAAEALEHYAGVVRPGDCCADERRNMNGGCDNCGDPCL